MHTYLIVGLIFVSFFLISLVLLHFLLIRKDPVRKRLQDLRADSPGSGATATAAHSSLTKSLGELIGPGAEQQSSTRSWLVRAGYWSPQSVFDYYSAVVLFAIALGLVAGLAAYIFLQETTQVLLMAGAGLVVGSIVPRLWVSRRIAKRRQAIKRAVPNMLDLMVVCVEAGLSVTAAIRRLVDEMAISSKALREELQLLNHEMLLGSSKADAFRNLAERTAVEELRSLAVTLIQADKLGTSIAKSLRILADTMRFNRRQKAEELANKTSIKLVFPLVLLIFPELLVVLAGPAVINLVRSFEGIVK